MATDDTEAPAGVGEAVRALPLTVSHALRTFRLVAGADRRLLVSLFATQLIDAGTAVAIAWVGKRLIDAVVAAAQHHGASEHARAALVLVVVEGLLVALKTSSGQVASHAQTSLRSALNLTVNVAILEKSLNVSHPRFEDPVFLNQMTQARREASARPIDLVLQSLAVLRHGATLVGYLALLWSLGAWALLALVLSSVPPFVAEARHGKALFALTRARTQRNRQAFYLEGLLTTEATAKESRLLAMGRWVVDRYREIHTQYRDEEQTLQRRRTRWAVGLGLLSAVVFYLSCGRIVMEATRGAITLGAMTLYLIVLRQGQTSLQAMLAAMTRAVEDNLYLSNLFEYLAVPDDEPDEVIPEGYDPGVGAPEVRFEAVSFRYPGSEREVLHEVSMTIAPGEAVALVGRNGAGKTTLVKLLTGLYRPTSGRVTVDGVDVRELGAPELRRRLGVVFQDFARFQFSAGDNVGVGWMPSRGDRSVIEKAVSDAGAEPVVQRLAQGLDTPLGRAFGGDDLSAGQWQRIALARAFMRKSRLLVLDEPTAAMDAEGEHEVFLRLRDLRAGRSALLITHRFSTVRMADRVVVLDDGRVVEEGPHSELLRKGGLYAKMFNLQADGYRD